MSWRAESTFKPTSKLANEEKEFLKSVKKLRDILKLEERLAKGEALETLQKEKVAGKDKVVKELSSMAVKLPGETEVFDKNQDIVDLLDASVMERFQKKKKQDQQRTERRQQQEAAKRDQPEFMSRHDKPIVDACLSDDGKHIFTCSKDKYVLCWSLESRLMQVITTFAGHKGAVFAVDVSRGPCGLASGGADGEIHFWQADVSKLRTGQIASPSATCSHGGIVRVIRWCPFDGPTPKDGRRFASASEKLVSTPPSICVWTVSERGQSKCVVRIDDPQVLKGKANDLRWGGGSIEKLFSCHDNGYVAVWNAQTGAFMKAIAVHKAPIMSLALSDDGATLATASHDQTARAIDVSNRDTPTLMTYKANRPLNAVCITPNFKAGADGTGSIVLAGGKNARDVTTQVTLEDEFESKVMDAASGAEKATTVRAHFGPVHRFLPLPGLVPGGAFASVAEDGTIKVHAMDDARQLHSDVME